MPATFAFVFGSRSARVTLLIACLASCGMCAVPLLGVQGPESALLLGVLLPLLAGGVMASACATLRARGSTATAETLLSAAGAFAFSLVAVPALVLWLDTLRIRNCTPLEGFVFMLLGPGFGTLLSSLCGVLCAAAFARARVAVACSVALPLGTILLALARFYATPAIFAYGHFYGVFPGTLYDEDVTLSEPFLWLRVASAVWIACIGLVIVSSVDPTTLRLSMPTTRQHRGAFALAALLCSAGVLSELNSVALHHTSSHAAIREMLGGALTSQRCQIYFPRELSRDDRARLADECDFGVVRAERWLGVTHPALANVYLFRSSDEKQLWMGAAGTNIAKPWRSEVFLSEGGFPNPTLGHELAHVVARGTGAGPLRIAGKLSGLWPDPALIEGVAVAAAWQTSGGLTPHEWAHAMQQLGLLPKLSSIFGPGFLAQQKRLAYTLSGSLLRFVAERHGAASVRKAYATGDLAGALGVSIDALDQEWQAYLRAESLAPRALALARARFLGPSIFSAVCPHKRAQLEDVLRSDLGAGDDSHAKDSCQRILQIDPGAESARAALVGVLARLHDDTGAEHELSALTVGGALNGAQNPYASLARQTLADEAARRGDRKTALALYDALLTEPIEDDALRQLQVKALAQRGSARQAQLLFELLVGEPGQRSDGATAVHLARELRSERPDGLPHYLEARQLYFQKRFALAAALLAQARALSLPTPELLSEALRIEALSRFASGELDTAAQLFNAYAADGTPGHSADAKDWLAHIAWEQR